MSSMPFVARGAIPEIDDEQHSPSSSQKKKRQKTNAGEEHRHLIVSNHFITLTHEQFKKLYQAATASASAVLASRPGQQHALGSLEYDLYDNAKYEDIACKPMLPKYDGLAKNLIPFLNWLHAR
jgi:hypothetical protein